ncbi:NIF3 (NGG1p interacting factor 3) [Corynebacterium kutscheri]|uniref:GTP cyclohydrolase 1 type 2 homolog n=1 Tax=Corynebacterium kutscheri TaxID=35755 RepID=A0A0F6QZ70_9CORY|nr:Nif3-like dinuclear metal center hexameric protein [Corynebacterium kutscheri]AKE40972.1 dinuclear metal center protein, YbgI/SA1388 family [Corynebacterium kutscheri]VEH06831.1 NIF3 (NGG1p interacting factor 3) [Corynebacterium kutscheri]VEH09271.1 NIF3 (NGG1p interacting factor 3) [Corynebacterium kutscheri]VEH79359.1 NIF3 (NGG1p interacting factor 3) [Corynebacterium kutscheri]
MTTVADIRRILDQAYPPHLAESWDAVGLVCGDPDDNVTKVVCALDCTQEVADAAVASGAQMLVVHHPLLMRGVTSVAADTPKGKVIHTLIKGGVALFSAHTNADSARPGVNDKLAELVGINAGRPISPKEKKIDLWGVQVPRDYLEVVKTALFAAGAGEIGNYSECVFEIPGTGEFLPDEAAQPVLGQVGVKESVAEIRIQCVAPQERRNAIIAALKQAHPYEEPAFDVVATGIPQDLEVAYGLGRIGQLPQPMRFQDFVQQVADNLPETQWGIRAAGDPESMVETIAVSSGSGDSFLDTVRTLGVDVYVTSDLRHHPVDEHLRAGGPFIIDTAHWASEFPWTAQAQEILCRELPDLEVEILDIRTDPWTLSAHKRAVTKDY